MRLLLTLAIAAPAFAAPFYTMTEIGTLGGGFSNGRAINANGVVAGISTLPSSTGHAVSWNGATLTDVTPTHPNRSDAYGINDAGIAVGIADVNPNFSADMAFYWNGTSMNFFDSLNAVRSYAWDINNNGLTVGTLQDPFNTFSGVVWNTLTGSPVALPVQTGNFTEALAINDAGVMAGQVRGPGLQHAMRLAAGTVQDLGTLGGNSSIAYSISENGFIAGTSDISTGEFHAFFWDGSTMHDLGALAGGYSWGAGVNSSRYTVGYSYDAQFNQTGMLWEGTSAMHIMDNLVTNANGRRIASLWAINDNGQITGVLRNGMGVRLDPVVPEPASIVLCAAGLALAIARGHRVFNHSTGKRASVSDAVRK
ncbi:MAG: hypothetical protein JNK48_24520 [Bryobacterales bacterium]|nr:hypothetical protein [Bryobacterales bacterium]